VNEIIIILFVLGYTAIALEHKIKLNKAASALITGVLCWTVYSIYIPDKHLINEQLTAHLGELSGILFFLLGAMTIVELIDSHDGFNVITNKITQRKKKSLIWIIGFITFLLSSILDNLTTTIVMISLLRKLVKDDNDRLYFTGIVIIAANAGGAWSPIGDVTTTMLWIGGQITTVNIISKLLIPSLFCLIIPLIFISFKLKGKVERTSNASSQHDKQIPKRHQQIVLFSGISILILVPVFKTLTHLPPYMGILLGLGLLWIITEIIHGSKEEEVKHKFSVVSALRKIDTPSILFFLGILMSIAALQSTGILTHIAEFMTASIGNDNLIVISIGLLSSVVDNVPLVAAAQGMYSLAQYPTDHYFWEFLAYCTGTGGSALIIGSAAGVAAMGMEKINFFWYLKNISWLALIGFFSGAIVYILQDYFLHFNGA
jgi:Na+/H+ antiporter NhaD/arsenite permease-like protein